MSLPRSTGQRPDRSDTKTLVRLGSGLLAVAAASQESGPASEPAPRSARRTPVQLWFKGLHEPVRARAELGTAGLELKAQLPFLELDSVVGFTTAEGDALTHGRIRHVRLELDPGDPVPRLAIALAIGDAPAPTASAGAPAAGAAQRAGAELRHDSRAQAPAARVLAWLAAGAIGAAAGAGAVYAFLAMPSAAPRPGPTGEQPRPAAAAQPRADESRAVQPPIPDEPPIMEVFAAERAAEQARLAEAAPPALPLAHTVLAPLLAEPAAEHAAPDLAAAAAELEPSAVEPVP